MYYVSIDCMLMCIIRDGLIFYFIYPSINFLLFKEIDVIATFSAYYHYVKYVFKFILDHHCNQTMEITRILHVVSVSLLLNMVSGCFLAIEISFWIPIWYIIVLYISKVTSTVAQTVELCEKTKHLNIYTGTTINNSGAKRGCCGNFGIGIVGCSIWSWTYIWVAYLQNKQCHLIYSYFLD